MSAIDCEAWHLAAVTILALSDVGEWLGCNGDGSSRPELEPAAAEPSSGKDAILTEAGAAMAPPSVQLQAGCSPSQQEAAAPELSSQVGVASTCTSELSCGRVHTETSSPLLELSQMACHQVLEARLHCPNQS